jgi:hypothetical protein
MVVVLLAPFSCRTAAADKPASAELDRLVRALVSEDADAAREAKQRLEALGAEVVPVLFNKLPAAVAPADLPPSSSFSIPHSPFRIPAAPAAGS